MEGVGKNDDGDKFWLQNDADYARLHRAAQKHLEEIHKRLDDLLHTHSGLDKEYTPTLTITSVARDEEQIQHIPNASQHSAHLYGIAFDLRSTGSDQRITHTKTGKIITLEGDDNAFFHYALREVLDQMRSEGKIFVIIEQSPAHFHIQSRIQEDATWIPPYLRERIGS